MQRILRILILGIFMTASSFMNYVPLSAEYSPVALSPNPDQPLFRYAKTDLWQYLRLGLNYLESPQPLSPPETVSPGYIHPDSKGFGPYGLSVEAYQDVQHFYPFFRQYSWQDILHSQKLYDLANQAFADWLLQNLQNYIPQRATQEQIFDILQQAWNLGLAGFKNGKLVVASRTRRAETFKENRLAHLASIATKGPALAGALNLISKSTTYLQF